MEKISLFMKRFSNSIKVFFIKYKEYIIIIGIVLISMPALYSPGFIYTHDGIIHLYRTQGVYENFKNLDFFNNIYYNVIDSQGYGWGIFYPPISSVLPAIFMLFGISLFTAEKIFMILAGIFAGIFSYKFFKDLFNNKFVALLCAIMYILSPYKINQSLIRGAMGEILIFTFFPIVMLGINKILKREFKYKYFLIIGAVGLVYSHIISVVYVALFCIFYLLLNIKKVLNKDVIKNFLISLIFIVLLSLPVLVPLAHHQFSGIYKISEIETDVSERVVHPGQLIMSEIQDKTAENTSYYSNDKEMNYMIGLTSIIILFLFPFAYKKIKEEKNIVQFIKYLSLFIISVLMMTVPFIWDNIMIFDVIQFPWRILSFATFYITVLSGYIIKAVINENTKYAFFIFVVGFSMLFVFKINTKVLFAKNLYNEFNFSNQTLNSDTTYGDLGFSLGYAHEYLPKNLDYEKIKLRGKELISQDCNVINLNYSKDKNYFIYNFEIDKNGCLEIPLIYYYGYDIYLNNEKVEYEISNDGYINIKINNPGKYNLKIKWNGTILYKICYFIASIAFISYILLYIKFYKRGKDNEKKYINS